MHAYNTYPDHCTDYEYYKVNQGVGEATLDMHWMCVSPHTSHMYDCVSVCNNSKMHTRCAPSSIVSPILVEQR